MVKRFLQARMPIGYTEQTYASPYWFVRIPHEVRLRVAVDAVLTHRPTALLDYGAGDGKFLVDLIEAGLNADIVAYEPVEEFRRALLERLRDRGFADRVRVVGSPDDLESATFDLVACLSVLEHMPLPQRRIFYDLCEATLSQPDGRILIDVPVEVGPSLLIKSLTRVVFKGRPAEYDRRTLLRLAAGARAFDPGRFDPSDSRTWIHDHKGFDYRLLREELEHRFRLVSERPTPFRWLPAPLGNQEVYFQAVRS